jgi:hypothetical protein
MFCPHCGAADQNPNAYCRQCGQWLVDQKSARRHGSKPEDRMKVMLVFNGLSAVLACVSALALYATYLNTPEAKWSIYVAGAFCSIIAVHQTVSFFFALGLTQKFRRSRETAGRQIESETRREPALLGSAETAPIIDAPSVTENTTELLEPSSLRSERPRGSGQG